LRARIFTEFTKIISHKNLGAISACAVDYTCGGILVVPTKVIEIGGRKIKHVNDRASAIERALSFCGNGNEALQRLSTFHCELELTSSAFWENNPARACKADWYRPMSP
jgi:hypothetical protein